MPSGVFRPYAGVSTAILLFTKTNSGGTDHVWFYDMQADSYLSGPQAHAAPENSDLPTSSPAGGTARRSASGADDQSFFVPKAEIAGNDYDLSINRYKDVKYEAVEYDPPM